MQLKEDIQNLKGKKQKFEVIIFDYGIISNKIFKLMILNLCISNKLIMKCKI